MNALGHFCVLRAVAHSRPEAVADCRRLPASSDRRQVDKKRWNGHKDDGVSALNLVSKLPELRLFLLQDPTEPVQLVQMYLVVEELLRKRPRVLEDLKYFHQFDILAQLGVDHLDILPIFPAEHPKSVEACLDVLGHLNGSTAAFFLVFEEAVGALDCLGSEVVPALAFEVGHGVYAANCTNKGLLCVIDQPKRAALFSGG